jgi:hypothetical protein
MVRRHNPWLDPTVELPATLRHLPLRQVKMLGEEWVICQHVNRIDNTERDTFGWMVRVGEHCRFFNDFEGPPQASLIKAYNFLNGVINE